MEFTHFNEDGNAIIVDVGGKQDSQRIAVAKGKIAMSPKCMEKLVKNETGKGDVLGVARIAGIMGAKRTHELIPLCHNIPITKLEIDFKVMEEVSEIEVICTAKTFAKTGIEMEALTGVSATLLTIYDMCKAVDKSMELKNIYLDYKSGGKSGVFSRDESER